MKLFNKINLLIVSSIIVLFFIKSGNAIRCYECSTDAIPECGWPESTAIRRFIRDCGPDVEKCRKVVARPYPNSAERIIRGCAYNSRPMIEGATEFLCKSNECNGSNRETIGFMSILVSVTAVILRMFY